MILKLLLLRALLATGVAYRPKPLAALTASRVDDVDDPALWDRWSALEERGVATAFQSRAFVEPLVRGLAVRQGLRPFVVEVSDAAGPLLAAAFVRRRQGRVEIVELADCGVSDYAAPLVRADVALEPDDTAALEAAIRSAMPAHDALFLRKMPERIAGRRNPFADFSGMRSMHTGTIAVDAAAAMAAGHGAVKEGLRKARKLVREGGAVRRIVDPAEAEIALDRLFAFRDARMVKRGTVDTSADPLVRGFYREVVPPAAASGFAVIYEIAAADRVLGIVQGFAYRGRFHGTLMGFAVDDPASASISPGLVGVVKALADHAETPGTIFDFGAGEQAYKARFGAVATDFVQVARAATLRGMAPVATDAARCEGRRLLRAHPDLAEKVRRLRGR